MDYIKTLSSLSPLLGITGRESEAAAAAAELLSPLCDTCAPDRFGNIVGLKKSAGSSPSSVMLMAHIDSIGMYVNSITEDGYLRFMTIGIDPRTLPDREVIIRGNDGKDYLGIVACLPPHVLTDEEKNKTIASDELAIDTGFSFEELNKLFQTGSPIRFKASFLNLQNGIISATSLDDRLGFSIILDVLEKLKGTALPFDLYAVASLEEERSGAGAASSAYLISPEYAVILDVTHAATPDAQDIPFSLGSGAVIGVGPTLNRRFTGAIISEAKNSGIPYVLEPLPSRTGTDADDVFVSRTGTAVAMISIPMKYMHTPFEAAKLSDLDHIAELLAGFLKTFDRRCL